MSSPLDPKTYCPISHEGFEALRADLAANKVVLDDKPDGSVDGPYGIKVSWHYEPASAAGAGWLRIQITGTEWIVKKAWVVVDEHVNRFVGK